MPAPDWSRGLHRRPAAHAGDTTGPVEEPQSAVPPKPYDPTLPVEGGERIVALENQNIESNTEMRRSMHDLVTWRREMRTVGEIGAFRTIARNVTVAGGPVEAVEVAQIMAVGFNIARVTPVLGRAIVAADESAGASPIAVIGYDVWHSRFGSDASVLGRELRVGTNAIAPDSIEPVMYHSLNRSTISLVFLTTSAARGLEPATNNFRWALTPHRHCRPQTRLRRHRRMRQRRQRIA